MGLFRSPSKSHHPILAPRVRTFLLISISAVVFYVLVSVSCLWSRETLKAYDFDTPTKIDHIVFGIGSSKNSWPNRRAYSKLWWDPHKMRGCVFVDAPLQDNHSDSHLLPPVFVSEDTSRFRYTWRGGDRSAIRIARTVLETVRLFNGSSDVRWYVFGDDDTIFFPDNLEKTLSKYDHTSWYYIGSNSEIYEQDSVFGFDMAFGGGGFALSSSLANVFAKVFDSCIERYPHLYGGDSRIYSCLSELGVGLTHEPGFHQFDVRGSALGLLISHPMKPIVSLHHMDHMDPIFPNSTTVAAVSHLFRAAAIDPARIFQLSVCYDRWFSWTISVSWGYAVQIHGRHMHLPDVLPAQETFRPWKPNQNVMSRQYTFNTREIRSDPCQRPVTFYMEDVSFTRHGTTSIRSVYRQAYENCTHDPVSSPRKIHEIRVFSNKFEPDVRQLRAPRRQCCDILPSTGGKIMEIGIRECKEDELIYMHP
ncbi:PREDICTED: uncharacterized protein LOC104826156 [Tarenaya hassleriana]|uniref:uncharacterized protein LOC104826156 n=1 Tax=Tarenaya hassleriana TaxID=28532 RepID=UPI00053C82B2|nr:PREDICTED: uncharacterized protein LOC104826156 [Tarenaya hassleriana]